jgi:hypothetical protein
LNPRYEDKGAKGDSADERDDEARVSDRKSQQVSYQEHKPTSDWMDTAP